MADVVTKIINGNDIRHGDVTAYVNQFGAREELERDTPDGVLVSETKLADRLTQERSLSINSTYVTVPASGQEVSYATPQGTDKLLFKARRSDVDITFGFNSGDASGVKKTTLFGGTVWESPTNYDLKNNQMFYFTSDTSGAIIEINFWR